MRKSVACLAVLVAAGVWLQACGGSDSEDSPAQPDAGFDASAQQPTGEKDASQPPPADSSADATANEDASDASDGGVTLDGGACDGGAIALTEITPAFGGTTTTTALTIRGTGFVSTPKAYLLVGGVPTPLVNVAFVTSTSVTATVPSGLAAGTYDVAIVNPDGCASILPAAFKVSAVQPPVVLGVSPAQGTTQSDVSVVVTGCNFPADAQLGTVDQSGTVTAQIVAAAPVAGVADTRCAGSPLYTMNGTIQTKTKAMVAGAYLVRVTNPTDASFGEYASFVVSNPSGNLLGSWAAASSLSVGRRSLGVATARLDDANRFLYAIGGEDAAGNPLDSVEFAPVDRFGQLGAWVTQKNKLATARSGHAVVHRGSYLYAIGGTSSVDGTKGANATNPSGTPLATVERAKLLLPSGQPKVTSSSPSTASGTLAPGAYYYRVAAVLDATDPDTQGETLPSEEVVATLDVAGSIVLTWTAPAVGNVAHYRVYRTAAPNGASGDEVLLADNVAGLTFTDGGSSTPGTERPMATGATGPWRATTSSLQHARLNTSATIATDPTGGLYVYVLGGYGQCTAAAASIMGCYEYAPLSSDGKTLGAFTAGVTTLLHPRMRHGADAVTAQNGPPNFATTAGANASFVVLAGGKALSTSANTTEYASVLAGGLLSTWASPTGFANERDATSLIIANGYGYALFGGNAPMYSATVDQSALSTATNATTFAFPNWSNAAANLTSKLGRHGAVAESAYFYVIGGSSNDTDALKTVYQIMH